MRFASHARILELLSGWDVTKTKKLDPFKSYGVLAELKERQSARSVFRAHGVLSELMNLCPSSQGFTFTECCQSTRSVGKSHGVFVELKESCQSTPSVVRARRVLSELTE